MRKDDIYLDGAVVKSVALGKTTTGKVQIGITFDTQDPDIRQATSYRFFTDDSLPYTQQDLQTLGWDPLANGWDIDGMLNSQAIVGAKADLVCEYEEYEGKTRLKVKFINAPGGAGMKEKLSPDDTKSFTASLQRKLGVTGGKNKTARKAAPVTVPDDDPPF